MARVAGAGGQRPPAPLAAPDALARDPYRYPLPSGGRRGQLPFACASSGASGSSSSRICHGLRFMRAGGTSRNVSPAAAGRRPPLHHRHSLPPPWCQRRFEPAETYAKSIGRYAKLWVDYVGHMTYSCL